MCWSSEVSALFAAIGFGYTYYVFRVAPPEKTCITDKIVVPFYTLMEFLQFIQHLYTDECSAANYRLTVAAHVLVWAQPFLANLCGFLETDRNKSVFELGMGMSLFAFGVSCVQLYAGETGSSFDSTILNVGKTCTVQGDRHLAWTFQYATLAGFNANWLLYGIILVFPNFFHSRHPFLRTLHWGVCLVLGMWYVGGVNNETISMWCAFTVPYGVVCYGPALLAGVGPWAKRRTSLYVSARPYSRPRQQAVDRALPRRQHGDMYL